MQPTVTKMRMARTVRGMRLFDVAAATGISEGRLSRIERRQLTPSTRERERLEALFAASTDELLSEASTSDAA
jgi:transcriptional regulator with XRE-family HTH domain